MAKEHSSAQFCMETHRKRALECPILYGEARRRALERPARSLGIASGALECVRGVLGGFVGGARVRSRGPRGFRRRRSSALRGVLGVSPRRSSAFEGVLGLRRGRSSAFEGASGVSSEAVEGAAGGRRRFAEALEGRGGGARASWEALGCAGRRRRRRG